MNIDLVLKNKLTNHQKKRLSLSLSEMSYSLIYWGFTDNSLPVLKAEYLTQSGELVPGQKSNPSR